MYRYIENIVTQTRSLDMLVEPNDIGVTKKSMKDHNQEESFKDYFEFSPFWYYNPMEIHVIEGGQK